MRSYIVIAKVLLRRPRGSALVILQLIFTFAFASNSGHMIQDRLDRIQRPTGDFHHVFYVQVIPNERSDFFQNMIERDLSVIRNLEGVVSATSSYAIPLSKVGFSARYYASNTIPLDQQNEFLVMANFFGVDEHAINTLGLTLVDGRDFSKDDIVNTSLEGEVETINVIVSKKLGETLFPGESALGKHIRGKKKKSLLIVGVIEGLIGWPNWTYSGNSILIPDVVANKSRFYLIRAKKDKFDLLVKSVPSVLNRLDARRIIYSSVKMKDQYYKVYSNDRIMIRSLVIFSLALVLMNMLSVYALSSLRFIQRKNMVSMRRALGARRIDIVHYFLAELFVISLIANSVGVIGAISTSYYLNLEFDLPLLSIEGVILWVCVFTFLNLISGIIPSIRASRVLPSLAAKAN